MKLQPIGSNQTVMRFDSYDKAILFSYETPVAAIIDGKAFKTDRQWSRTTSKHINSWLKYYDWVDIKPQEFFNALVGGI